MDSSHLAAIRQQFRLSESIVRMLFVKVDPRIVDTLVAHALAGPAALAAERRAAEARAAEAEKAASLADEVGIGAGLDGEGLGGIDD